MSAQLHVPLEPVNANADERMEDSSRDEKRPPVFEARSHTDTRAAAAGTSMRRVIRSIGRALLWPFRRFFDPRFQGLARQIDAVRDHLDERGEEVRQVVGETRALVHAEANAVSESTALIGESLNELRREIGSVAIATESVAELRQLVEQRVAMIHPRTGPEIPPQVPWNEDYVESQRLFVAEVLDSSELIAQFERGDTLPRGYGIGLDERVVEYPWIFAQRLEGRTLDAGSSLNHLHVLDRFLPRFAELQIVTLAPEETSFHERRISYVYADLRDLPFRDAYFDTVVSISTIDHIGMDNSQFGVDTPMADDPQAEARLALAELARVTSPGGTLLFTVPYGRPENLGHTRQFDRTALEELIETAGAGDVSVVVYRYGEVGWQISSLEDATDARFHDYLTDPCATEDLAAAARAVACVRLAF
jgi:SAM-dependent methyltransferase